MRRWDAGSQNSQHWNFNFGLCSGPAPAQWGADQWEARKSQSQPIRGRAVVAASISNWYKGESHASLCLPNHIIKFPNSNFNITRYLDKLQPFVKQGYTEILKSTLLYKETWKRKFHDVTSNVTKNTKNEQVLITSVSSSDHSYLQFTFDFMNSTQKFNMSYFEQKRKSYLILD